MKTTVEQEIKNIECLVDTITGGLNRYQTLGAKNAEALIKSRVHNDGKDAFGRPLGGYSPGYAKKRAKNGRQAARKDLQFTGKLFNSEQVFKLGKNVVFGFRRGKRRDVQMSNAALAATLEENLNTQIFVASESEMAKIEEAVLNEIDKDFNKCMK